jgi:hypothetical protein
VLRVSLAGACLAALLLAPIVWALGLGLIGTGSFERLAEAALAAIDAVGFVVVPQAVLAVAVLGLAVHHLASRLAGLELPAAPSWLAPAVESALLLGMLGTIAGMVRGFSGLSPDTLEPGPLVQSLGAALRSSFVGFGIALVGVWLGPREHDPQPPEPAT